jgi:hypothetical protein
MKLYKTVIQVREAIGNNNLRFVELCKNKYGETILHSFHNETTYLEGSAKKVKAVFNLLNKH